MWKFSDYLSVWSSASAFIIPYSPSENSLKQRDGGSCQTTSQPSKGGILCRGLYPHRAKIVTLMIILAIIMTINIKLNHSITPEEPGGNRNVCTLVFFVFLGLVQKVEGRMFEKQESHPIVCVTSGWLTDNNCPAVMLRPIAISLVSLVAAHI